jgi:hypothetical protein
VHNDVAEIFGGVFGKKFLPRWCVEIGVIYSYQQLHGHQRLAQTFASLARSAQAVWHFLEVISKRQIAFESKAQADEKAQHTPFPEISGDLQQFSRVPMPQRRIYSSWLFDGLLENV